MSHHFFNGATEIDAGANFISAVLLGFPALFSIINPIGSSLIFQRITANRTSQEKKILARLVVFYSFVILTVSIWGGGWILSFFGITMDALRVAGGLVVTVRAWSLLQAPEENEAQKEEQAVQGGRTIYALLLKDIAFFPLAIPFTVGPGAIAVAIALASEHPTGKNMVLYFIGLNVAAAVACVIIWVTYSFSDIVMRVLGKTGARIVSRLTALILLCIGVQILSSGIQGLLFSVIKLALRE